MVKEELVEGLKTAMIRGDSLQKAMFSFYNAGYKKAEIEEAARFLQASRFSPERYLSSQPIAQQPIAQRQITPQPRKPLVRPIAPEPIKTVPREQIIAIKPQPVSASANVTPTYDPTKPREIKGDVSEYKNKKHKSPIGIILLLVAVLLVLLGILLGIIFFKTEILALVKSIFK